jgi:hypothetical protein
MAAASPVPNIFEIDLLARPIMCPDSPNCAASAARV